MSLADEDRGSQTYRLERHFARQCALQFLYQCDVQDEWEDISRRLGELRRQVRDLEAIPAEINFDRAWEFTQVLAHGVCAKRTDLDDLLAKAATNWTVDRMSLVDRNILRLAACEVCYVKKSPPVMAVDEGVELAKNFGHADSKRFVNGVLDRILHLQERGEITPADPEGESGT
jgi:N utilization substance protein B